MVSVASLAARAFDRIAATVSDAVMPCTLTHQEQGAYNPGTGEYDIITTQTDGRVVFATAQPIDDMFPGYVAAPGEVLVYAEGFDFAPVENDGLSIGGTGHTVTEVGDIAGASGAWALMVVRS